MAAENNTRRVVGHAAKWALQYLFVFLWLTCTDTALSGHSHISPEVQSYWFMYLCSRYISLSVRRLHSLYCRPYSRIRSSSEWMSPLLAITTERWSQEIVPINEVGWQAAEVLSVFKTHSARGKDEVIERYIRQKLRDYIKSIYPRWQCPLIDCTAEIFSVQDAVHEQEHRCNAKKRSARSNSRTSDVFIDYDYYDAHK